MMARCFNPEHHKFPRYGGRGITVCDEWKDFHVFLRDMGPKPTPQHSIDRKDGKLGYFPGNCRWATVWTQNNNRSNTLSISVDGVKLGLNEIIEASGSVHSTGTVAKRVRRGWSLRDALERPLTTNGNWDQAYTQDRSTRLRRARQAHPRTRRFTIDGIRLTVSQIVEKYPCAVDAKTVYKRLARGWDVHEALSTPNQGNHGIYHAPRNGPLRHSEEAKKKISDAQKNRVHGPMSEETKEKIRQANTGLRRSAETCERIRDAKLGVPRSKETNAKISAALKGRPMSEETKAKMRLAQQRRRERERD